MAEDKQLYQPVIKNNQRAVTLKYHERIGEEMILIISTKCKEKAYGFIKSCKSVSRVMDMGEQMFQFADNHNLDLEDIIVDDEGCYDVDRRKINELMEGVECGRYSIILIRDIADITDDLIEQSYFVHKVQSFGGSVISIYDGQIAWNDEDC